MSDAAAIWIFDLAPASQARRGGDPSSHVFEHDIETFVREVVQNANDQAISAPSVVFRFCELTGPDLEEFFEAIGWRSLAPHLDAAAADELRGAALRANLTELEEAGRLRLLIVEDTGTTGLTGGESGDDSRFTALCRDTLYSHKDGVGAGGSYGLGKSVMWSFSGLNTVLFCSTLSEDPAGHSSPRLIGRAELPSHCIDVGARDRWYAGQGWFGVPSATDNGTRAESLWGQGAVDLARGLSLSRPASCGTSIGILDFRDPSSDEALDDETFAARIQAAATRYFWPAMSRPSEPLQVAIETSGESLRWAEVEDIAEVRPFVRCLRGAEHAVERLDGSGRVARVDVPIRIPGRYDGAGPVDGLVTLLVAAAPEAAPMVNHVAFFRGPGMVVRYWRRDRVALGTPPFHAVLLCGFARSAFVAGEPQDADVEAFLRAAEPPGHDQWYSTPALKTRYRRGYRKSLDDMHKGVSRALAKLLAPEPLDGRRGPDRLRKRFPLGGSGPATVTRGASPFRFNSVQITWGGDRWSFFGSIGLAVPAPLGWEARILLRPVAEDGARVDYPVRISHFDIDTGATARIEDFDAVVDAAPGTESVEFFGESDTALPGEIELEVRGVLRE